MAQFFTPLSTGLMLTAAALWVVIAATTVIAWDRISVAPVFVRSIGIFVSMLLLSLAVFIMVNQQIRLFLHWSDILGGW